MADVWAEGQTMSEEVGGESPARRRIPETERGRRRVPARGEFQNFSATRRMGIGGCIYASWSAVDMLRMAFYRGKAITLPIVAVYGARDGAVVRNGSSVGAVGNAHRAKLPTYRAQYRCATRIPSSRGSRPKQRRAAGSISPYEPDDPS